MKMLWQIVLLLALFPMDACTSRGDVDSAARRHGTSLPTTASAELAAVDSLLWRQPDSALAVLLPWFDTCGNAKSCVSTDTAYDQHYAHLLLSELLYKNYYAQTNRAELLQAVGYFDSLALIPIGHTHALRRHCGLDPQSPTQRDIIAFLSARAHYINGVGYYEHDSVVPACKEYLKALEVMENRFEEQQLTWQKNDFLAFIYTRLTELFSNLYLHEQAIHFSKESLRYYEKHNASSNHIVWALNEIGSNYDMLEQLDSADYYYGKAIQVLDDTSTLLYRIIASHQAYLEYKKDPFNADTAISCLYDMLSKSESDKERITLYSYLGEILFHEKQFDSSYMFLIDVFQHSTNNGSQKHAAERLVEICKAQQKDFEILEYANFLVPFANQEENKSEIKSQMTELYKIFSQEELERLHRHDIRKQNKRTFAIIIGMLCIILIISHMYRYKRMHEQHLETIIESERQTHKIQQAALAGRLRRSNATLKEYGNKVSPIIPQQKSLAEKYEDEAICQHILTLCHDPNNSIKSTVPVSAYSSMALNDIQKAQLKNAAIMHYGLLLEELKIQHPQLKEKDFLYFYLCLLGLDNVQISVLLQNSLSTTWERESRLKKILGSKDRVAITLHGYLETS